MSRTMTANWRPSGNLITKLGLPLVPGPSAPLLLVLHESSLYPAQCGELASPRACISYTHFRLAPPAGLSLRRPG